MPDPPPALRAGPNRLSFGFLGLHWNPPESGDLWCKSEGSKEAIWSRSEGWWPQTPPIVTFGALLHQSARLSRHTHAASPSPLATN
jgi:hypothetical protein